MRVLVTGTTAKQVGSKRAFQVALNSGSLVETLQQGGHEVDWRPVIPGEDLTAYDRVVVYLGPANALGSVHMYGALWALAARPDAALALDDWQVKQVIAGAKTLHKKPAAEGLFKPILNRGHRDEAAEHTPEILRALGELAHGVGAEQRTCFTPMFRKGDPLKLQFLPVKKHVVFDPTVIWIKRYSEIVEAARDEGRVTPKQQQWVHASLLSKDDWVKKQSFRWPVLAFGNAAGQQARVPEVELVPIVAGSWGMLSAAHNNPSSGWWRVRFAIAAACDTIIYGDLRELSVIYGGGNFPRFVSEVENVSEDQRRALALKQRVAVTQQMMGWQELTDVINEGIQQL